MKRLFTGKVPVNKEHLKGTVPLNKKQLTGTSKKWKRLCAGTVPVNKKHLTGTLKNEAFPKNTPTPSKYPLVRPQKCQSFVQRLRGTLFSKGNQLSVNSPL